MNETQRAVVAFLIVVFVSLPGQLITALLLDGARIPEWIGPVLTPALVTLVVVLLRRRSGGWVRGAIIGGALSTLIVGACWKMMSGMSFH